MWICNSNIVFLHGFGLNCASNYIRNSNTYQLYTEIVFCFFFLRFSVSFSRFLVFFFYLFIRIALFSVKLCLLLLLLLFFFCWLILMFWNFSVRRSFVFSRVRACTHQDRSCWFGRSDWSVRRKMLHWYEKCTNTTVNFPTVRRNIWFSCCVRVFSFAAAVAAAVDVILQLLCSVYVDVYQTYIARIKGMKEEEKKNANVLYVVLHMYISHTMCIHRHRYYNGI